jgi:hypothetical protein
MIEFFSEQTWAGAFALDNIFVFLILAPVLVVVIGPILLVFKLKENDSVMQEVIATEWKSFARVILSIAIYLGGWGAIYAVSFWGHWDIGFITIFVIHPLLIYLSAWPLAPSISWGPAVIRLIRYIRLKKRKTSAQV